MSIDDCVVKRAIEQGIDIPEGRWRMFVSFWQDGNDWYYAIDPELPEMFREDAAKRAVEHISTLIPGE